MASDDPERDDVVRSDLAREQPATANEQAVSEPCEAPRPSPLQRPGRTQSSLSSLLTKLISRILALVYRMVSNRVRSICLFAVLLSMTSCVRTVATRTQWAPLEQSKLAMVRTSAPFTLMGGTSTASTSKSTLCTSAQFKSNSTSWARTLTLRPTRTPTNGLSCASCASTVCQDTSRTSLATTFPPLPKGSTQATLAYCPIPVDKSFTTLMAAGQHVLLA